jgi:hypothetical protein
MDWETSNSADVNTSLGNEDMDGFNGDDFLAALEGNDGLEDQQTAAEGAEETVQDGAENQRAEEQQEEPENQPPEGGEVPPETVEQPVQTVPLVYNGQQIMLPADAVQALTGALGANPVELLQKGMNYDRKAEREMRVLDQYAEAAGMNRQQYLEQLEGARNEQLLSAEIEKCRAEFPETPDAALKAIAEGRMASQRAAAAQAAEQQRAELTAMQQRIDQTVEQAREEADARAWEEYVSLSGVKSFEEVPKRVLELVQQEAMTPVAAHWRYQAELNQQAVRIAEKNQTNRQTSPGSMTGTGEESGFEADFLRAFKF